MELTRFPCKFLGKRLQLLRVFGNNSGERFFPVHLLHYEPVSLAIRDKFYHLGAADTHLIQRQRPLEFTFRNIQSVSNLVIGRVLWGERGVTAGFKSAKKQGCKVVVIDLDEHILAVRAFELSKYIARRKADFTTGMITDCYVVFAGEAVRVNARPDEEEGN